MTALMKALTNKQILEIYSAHEQGVSKAELSRKYEVNVKSIKKAIDLTNELRNVAKAATKIESEIQVVKTLSIKCRPKGDVKIKNEYTSNVQKFQKKEKVVAPMPKTSMFYAFQNARK